MAANRDPLTPHAHTVPRAAPIHHSSRSWPRLLPWQGNVIPVDDGIRAGRMAGDYVADGGARFSNSAFLTRSATDRAPILRMSWPR